MARRDICSKSSGSISTSCSFSSSASLPTSVRSLKTARPSCSIAAHGSPNGWLSKCMVHAPLAKVLTGRAAVHLPAAPLALQLLRLPARLFVAHPAVLDGVGLLAAARGRPVDADGGLVPLLRLLLVVAGHLGTMNSGRRLRQMPLLRRLLVVVERQILI